jgi:hypothetical protein
LPQKKQQLCSGKSGVSLQSGYGFGDETIVTPCWDALATHGDGVCAVI